MLRGLPHCVVVARGRGGVQGASTYVTNLHIIMSSTIFRNVYCCSRGMRHFDLVLRKNSELL